MKQVATFIRPNATVRETEQQLACQQYAQMNDLIICKEYIATDDCEFDFAAKLPRDPIMCVKADMQAGLYSGLLVFNLSLVGRDELETIIAINWFWRHGMDIYCVESASKS